MLGLFFLLLLNFGISWFNAWSVGKSWIETKQAGGWPRFMAWCGATMSASGFTWVYVAILGIIAQATGKVPPKYVEAMFSLGYLTVILPIIGSGLAITAQSWAHFWRERNFGSGAVAGWNTFAQIYNIYEATSAIPAAFKSLGGVFGDDDEDNGLLPLVIMAVVFAVLGGVLTTVAIVRRTARNHAGDLAVQQELRGAR